MTFTQLCDKIQPWFVIVFNTFPMSAKKYLEIAALSASLLTLNCDDNHDPAIGDIYNRNPDIGGIAGNSGSNGVAGLAGKSGEAGTLNHAGTAGNSENCDLIDGISVSQKAFDLTQGVSQKISFTLKNSSESSVSIKSNGQIISVVKPPSHYPAGISSVNWNGTDSQGEKVPNGVYIAEVISTKNKCQDAASIAFSVKNGIVECLLSVGPAQSVNSVVTAGSPSVQMACFRLKNEDCEMEVQGLTLTNLGPSSADKYLFNNRLADSNYQAIGGGEGNFDQTGRVNFQQGMSVKMPPQSEKTFCLVSDIAPNSVDNLFRINVAGPSDINVKPSIDKPVVINGVFPVSGPDIYVTYDN